MRHDFLLNQTGMGYFPSFEDEVLHTTPLLIASQGGHVEAVRELSAPILV